MFHWLKKFFVKKMKEPETVSVSFILPNGKKFEIEALKLDIDSHIEKMRCKKHPKYDGIKDPKENCNDCWEFHYQRKRI